MQRKPVVVTGGAGFIGSHLVDRLLADGENVIVIDDFSTGSEANLSAAKLNPRLTVIRSKVSEVPNLGELISGASYVFHLAAAVGVELVMTSPIRTIETNLGETEAILAAAAPSKVPLLLASTSEVYGKSAKPVFSEEDDLLIGPPTLGRWSYACSKLMDEFLALAYMRERGLPVTIVRFFNTVGPRQTGVYGMVLPRFVEAARKGQSLKVYGNGAQTRCFCHVQDAVEALVRLKSCSEAAGTVINVGNDQVVTILELAKQVIQLARSKSQIEFVPYTVAFGAGFEDMLHRRPSLGRLESVARFKPTITLEAIVTDLVRYQENTAKIVE